jgi:hypothetical protein
VSLPLNLTVIVRVSNLPSVKGLWCICTLSPCLTRKPTPPPFFFLLHLYIKGWYPGICYSFDTQTARYRSQFKLTIYMSLNFYLTWSFWVSFKSHSNFLTTSVLDIAHSLVWMYLLQFMLRGWLSISKIIGRLSTYQKIIGGFQNIDNQYR